MAGRLTFCSLIAASFLVGSLSLPAAAQVADAQVETAQTIVKKPFVKKRYSIRGDWSVVKDGETTQIHFSDDFKTKGGPDLKVFLSKSPINDIDSKTALASSRSIGVLKSKSGGQIYTIPDDVELSDYKSVIIHCEAFSVLWGGFDLPTTP